MNFHVEVPVPQAELSPTVIDMDDVLPLVVCEPASTHTKILRPAGDRFNNDEAFRRQAMRARSVLAVLLLADHLDAKVIDVRGEPVLLVCNRDRMLEAEADATFLLDLDLVPHDTKAVVPTVDGQNWRKQPGWMLILDPEPEDYKMVYLYVRSSILWLDDRKEVTDMLFKAFGLSPNVGGNHLADSIRRECEVLMD